MFTFLLLSSVFLLVRGDSDFVETVPSFALDFSESLFENEPMAAPFTIEMTEQMLNGRRELIVEDGRRGLEELNAPDEWYETCVYWVNAVRAREGLPALKRWREKEPCTDQQAQYDYAQYRDNGRPHAAFADRQHCNIGGSNGILAQNSCPLWVNDIRANERCTVAMWEEKQTPGVTENLMCASGVSSDCGHYWTLRGGREGTGGYNAYDRVACGFYFHPTENRIYLNQNFGHAGNEFLCGGDNAQKPQSNLVADCNVRGDYGSCANVGNVDFDIPGCEWAECDPNFDSNTMSCSDSNGCPSESDRCETSYFLTGSGEFSEWFKYRCRNVCNSCSCGNAPTTDAVVCLNCPTQPAQCEPSCEANGNFCVVTENSCKSCSTATCQQCVEGSCPACHRCDPVHGCVPTAGATCDDGNEFTHSDVCTVDGNCEGTPLDVSENVFCFDVENDPSQMSAANFAEGDFVLQGSYNQKGWYRSFQSEAVLYFHSSLGAWVITLPQASKQPGDSMSIRCFGNSDPSDCTNWEQFAGGSTWNPIAFIVGRHVCPCKEQIDACPFISSPNLCTSNYLIPTCPKRCEKCYTEPGTEAPITAAPITSAPVTEAPITAAPVTQAPITAPPVTAAPVTSAPVTEAPITSAPVTQAPITAAPVTQAPITSAPVTQAPITSAPVTQAPITAAPVTEAPITSAPVTQAPITAAPVTSAPVTQTPITAAPVTSAPVTQVPITAAPVTAEPTTSTLEPTTSTAEPTTSTLEPTTSTLEPTTSTLEPTTSTLEPTTSTSEPTTSTLEPTTSTSEPTTSTLEPTTSTLEPTTSTLEPTTSTLEPTTSTLEPTTSTLEPTTSTLEPTTSTFEPTTSTLEPTTSTAEPTTTTTTFPEYDCRTRELWTEEKAEWCCENENLGCPDKEFSLENSLWDQENLGGATAFVVAGNFAYIGAYRRYRFTVVDVTDPKNLRVEGSVEDTEVLKQITAVAVSGNYAFVASLTKTLSVIDISDKSAPKIVTSVHDKINFRNVRAMLKDKNRPILYVASKNRGAVAVVDISNPAAPRVAKSFRHWKLKGTGSLAQRGQDLYAVTNKGRLVELDCASPLVRLQLTADVYNNQEMKDARAMIIEADFAYISSRQRNSVSIYRVGGRKFEKVHYLRDTQNLRGAEGMALDRQRNLLFVATPFSHGVTAINISTMEVVDKYWRDLANLKWCKTIAIKNDVLFLPSSAQNRFTSVSYN